MVLNVGFRRAAISVSSYSLSDGKLRERLRTSPRHRAWSAEQRLAYGLSTPGARCFCLCHAAEFHDGQISGKGWWVLTLTVRVC